MILQKFASLLALLLIGALVVAVDGQQERGIPAANHAVSSV
jgi:hypothetical protein